jgi:hypothetical protein
MNKTIGELVKIDSVYRAAAIGAAAAAPAVTPLVPLGGRERKARFCISVASTDLDNTGAFQVGIVDDTVALPAATGNLATRFAAGETLKYRAVAAGELVAGCRTMTISVVGAAAGDTVVLNGTTFTNAAVPATAFEWDDRDALVAAVNAAGIGITASAGAANIAQFAVTTLGDQVITYSTNAAARITPALTLITLYSFQMEVDASELNAGATGCYAVVDFTAGVGAVTVHGDVVRGHGRYNPYQAAAFSL